MFIVLCHLSLCHASCHSEWSEKSQVAPWRFFAPLRMTGQRTHSSLTEEGGAIHCAPTKIDNLVCGLFLLNGLFLVINALEELVERIGKLLHPFILELLRNLIVVNANLL